MASSTSEATPLLPSHSRSSAKSAKPSRSVTFNPQVSTSSPPRRRPALPPTTTNTAGTLSSPFVSGRDGPSQPMLSALNSKLRRRNSSGAPLQYMPQVPASKIGPQRTTRTAQKLKLLPNPENEEDDEESGREVYSQFTRIKDPTARRDAARLGKDDRAKLPRVTAYCTASSYKMDDLMRFLKGRAKTKSAAPKLFDECLYSPYRYKQEGSSRRRSSGAEPQDEQEAREAVIEVRSEPVRRFSDSAIEVEENAERRREDLIDFQDPRPSTDDLLGATSSQSQLFASSSHPFTVDDSILPATNTNTADDPTFSTTPETRPLTPDFDTTIHIPEIFLFEYGVVVLWGFTLPEEQRFLREISKFEQEKLGKDDVQTEEFNFYYTREYQARIYNDFVSLKKKRDYMTKLAISHALAQSTKLIRTEEHERTTDSRNPPQTSLYEDLLDSTITTTSTIPASIARTGRIALTRREINMQIGELFILRINIHLQGSVLDAPELMWAEPQLEPVYQAVRSYLEMDQRVELMQERVSVVGDLLAVLKDQLSHTHGEYLEWIVIVLIAAEILVAAINIVVD
ncbi:sporulation protein rmd1, partial [Friedmanniomyces endolithicus]